MKVLLSLLLILAAFVAHAQYDPYYKKSKRQPYQEDGFSSVDLGFGLGLSYGGVGGRVSVFPVLAAGVFGAVGYNLHKTGYNVGGIGRILPKKKVCPVVMGMYGHNGVIVIQGRDEFNKTYYGPTFGGGMEIRFMNYETYLNLELLIPIRSQEWYDDIDVIRTLSKQGLIEDFVEPLPFSISIGCHFRFKL
jgi:hypothetical protein